MYACAYIYIYNIIYIYMDRYRQPGRQGGRQIDTETPPKKKQSIWEDIDADYGDSSLFEQNITVQSFGGKMIVGI